MLFYSWKKIHLYAGKSAHRIILCLQSMLHEGLLPHRNHYLYPYKQKDFTGDSYLLNPYDLVKDLDVSMKEIADYIALASFRNYSVYATTKDARLDILHSPLNEEQLKQNRLLSIENERILFKHEEVTNRRK